MGYLVYVISVYETLDLFFCSQGCTGAPVDKLLFLKSRAQWKTQESAVLVSSEAGTLEFWCLYGANRPMGMYANMTCYSSHRITLGSKQSPNIMAPEVAKVMNNIYRKNRYLVKKR